MFILVKKLSSTVRRLAERHARLQGEVLRLQAVADETAGKLLRSRAHLDAVTLVLPTFERRVQPALIEPLCAFEQRYGKRGALLKVILEFVRAASPGWTSTAAVADAVEKHFDCRFRDGVHRKNWASGIVYPSLWRQSQRGILERDTREKGHAARSYWRITVPLVLSLDDLRAEAAAAGLATT